MKRAHSHFLATSLQSLKFQRGLLLRGVTLNILSNIYNFTDYRDFLKDRYRQLKDADPLFSFRYFSKQAGFGSPNYLKLVMDGKRNLSEEAIGKFAKGLRLDNHEGEYFRYMVEYNQCDNASKKQVFEAKLMYLRELFKVKTLIPELYDYYHEWYHSAIREMVKKGKVKNDPGIIAQSLVPNISEGEAMASIALLTKLHFVAVGADGCLEATENKEIDAETASMGQKIHFEQMAELAAQSLYTQGPETQDFESVTLSLPMEKVNELRTKIQELIASVKGSATQNPNDSVYQLNVQLFALTKQVEQPKPKSPEKAA